MSIRVRKDRGDLPGPSRTSETLARHWQVLVAECATTRS
jgi:hypothetical protein